MRRAFMTFSCPSFSLQEALDLARRLGWDGIEPRTATNHAHGVELGASWSKRTEMRRRVEASGVALACIATSLRYADTGGAAASQAAGRGLGTAARERVTETRRYIELAAGLGCRRLRVFAGPIPPGVERRRAADAVVACLAAAAPHAAAAGVTLCVETHDDWCHPDDLIGLLEAVGSPAVAANWDVMHPVLFAKLTVEETWQKLKPWVRHVHVHDGYRDESGKIVFAPIGEGTIDHREALRLLADAGYQGFISGEWIDWGAGEELLSRELATLKAMEASLAKR